MEGSWASAGWRMQVPAAKSRLNQGDVFILDLGLKVYQWNGSSSSAFEKNKVCDVLYAVYLFCGYQGLIVLADTSRDEGKVQITAARLSRRGKFNRDSASSLSQ